MLANLKIYTMEFKKNQRKLLITTEVFAPDVGESASYGRLLAQKLATDWQITVITYSSVFNFAEDKNLNFKVIRVWKKWPWFLRHIIYFLKVAIETAKSDQVLVLNVLIGGLPVLIFSKIFRKKYLVKIVGDRAWEAAINKRKTSLLIDDFQKARKWGWIGLIARIQSLICKKADLVIVPSRYLEKMVTGWGVDAEKIKVIYNSVDFESVNMNREKARVKIGIPGSIILSIGRLVPWKGFRMLIKIMPQLLEINSFFRLIIIGEGPEKKILEIMIKNLRLENKVFILGRKNKKELVIYLAAADIFVLNTGYEGFSHQILEAMAAGTPVITTAVGSNLEIIKQGENGFMIRYNDEFNLMEAIKTVFKTPELREQFIEEGKETVAHFNVDKMIEETEKILNL